MGRPKGTKNPPRSLGPVVFRVRVGDTIIPVYQLDIDRFDKYVLGGRWVGGLATGGYGRLTVGGKSVLAHVFQWTRYHKILIPKGLQIDHINFDRLDLSKDNLRCVPQWLNFKEVSVDGAHRRQRSRQSNGHLVRGEKHGMCKFSDDQVRRIRDDYKNGAGSQEELAQKYGCSQATVWSIVNKKTHRLETNTENELE